MKFVAAVAIVFAAATFPASTSAAGTSDCPLLGSTAKAKASFDYNCSFTLAENEMFHSAPERIHKKMVNTIQNHKGKIKRIATRRLHNKHWRQKIRARTKAGRRHVDDKKADDAGRKLRDWFKRYFRWPMSTRGPTGSGSPAASGPR